MLAAVLLFGTALAQQQADNPFGSLPEPPTEHLPPADVLDRENPDFGRLQAPEEGTAGLPRDKRGEVDWVRSLAEGRIKPRGGLRADAPPQLLQLDTVMRNTAGMPFVKFPHEAHTRWLACTSCHDGLFAPKAGANSTTMAQIFRGESCGACHGRVAFTPMFECERCHNVLQPGQQRWW